MWQIKPHLYLSLESAYKTYQLQKKKGMKEAEFDLYTHIEPLNPESYEISLEHNPKYLLTGC
jgi:hypothetical protein